MNEELRKETPHISLGMFDLRLPFIHYRWEVSETVQALFLFSVAMAAIPIIQDAFPWVSFEIAWTAVFWFTLVFWLTGAFGDPSIPGWITASIPVVVAYLKTYPGDADRVWALVCVQLILAVLCIITGPTGLADWLNRRVPVSLRAGIVLGAGFSAIVGEIQTGGRALASPWGIGVATLLSFYLLYSYGFKQLQSKAAFMKGLAKYGYVPALIVGSIVALIAREAPMPQVEWGIFIPRISEQLASMTIFGYGWPPIEHFISAFPTALVVYIILFGDWLIIDALRTEAMSVRKDAHIDFKIARSSMIVALRNAWTAIFAPFAPLCGPLWAGAAVAIYERYKTGKENMPTIWGGLMSFQNCWPILVFIVPLITLLKPFLAIGTSTTLLIQGFACCYIAMSMMKDRNDLGIAGCVAIALWKFGAAGALITGAVLWFLLVRTSGTTSSKSLNG